MVSQAETSNRPPQDPKERTQPDRHAFGIIQRQLDEHTTLVTVEGELDLANAPRLKWMLIESLDNSMLSALAGAIVAGR